ncbi:MAG TPA: hypothetical protein VGW10_12130 [Solirubrobacteraceae bacterium]|nr:hypothetical protein [Solirubrobacteraceae bacterium]
MATIENARDPVNELYDRGCELVEAATAMRRAAAAADVARAAPAVLSCFETALDEMVDTSAALERVTHQAVSERGIDTDAEWHERHARMRSGFSHLHRSLRDARDLAAAARTRTSRALTGAGLTRARTPG